MATNNAASTMSVPRPLSLQDNCKLKILSCIDSYPVCWLCKLPLALRKQLINVLPIFDRLHFENTEFCKELDVVGVAQVASDLGVISGLTGDTDNIKDQLVAALFKGKAHNACLLIQGSRLNLEKAFDFFDCLSCPFGGKDQNQLAHSLVNYILNSASKMFVALKDYSTDDQHGRRVSVSVLIPERFTKFFAIDIHQWYYAIRTKFINLKDFVFYCNIETITIGAELSLDLLEFAESPVLDEFRVIRDKTEKAVGTEQSDNVIVFNPTCLFIQDMLSSVEVLTLGTGDRFEPDLINEDDVSVCAPYFILRNIVSSKNPKLKSIHVYGIPDTVKNTLDTVAGFLCGEDYTINGSRYLYSETGQEYGLMSPDKPYYGIENLQFDFSSGDYDYVRQYLTSYDSDQLSSIANEVIKSQVANIKTFSISGLGFLYEDIDTSSERLGSSSVNRGDLRIVNSDGYRTLLSSSLVLLVQSPQFRSLSVDDAPEKNCCDLVTEFLSAPASHEQQLSISLKEEKPSILGYFDNTSVPDSLPETNLQYKSLDLGRKKSQLQQHIVRFPNLILKHLHISASNLTTASCKVNISTIQLYVNCVPRKLVIIDAEKLDLFVSQNPSLTTLAFSLSGHSGKQECPSFFPALNTCLKRLLEKKHTLNEIRLNGVIFSDFTNSLSFGIKSTDGGAEDGYDFKKWANRGIQLSSFSSSPSQFVAAVNIIIPKNVHDKDLYLFFMLVQRLGITLILSEFEFSGVLIHSLIPMLEHAFGGSKINKIVLKNSTDAAEIFKKIASTVVIE